MDIFFSLLIHEKDSRFMQCTLQMNKFIGYTEEQDLIDLNIWEDCFFNLINRIFIHLR